MEPKSKKVLVIASIFCIGLIVLCVLIKSSKSDNYNEQTIKMSKLLSASIYLAEQAGKKIVKVRRNDDPDIQAKVKGRTNEGAKEYVTLGDQRSHNVIVGGLLSVWPSLHYRSEEIGLSQETMLLPLYNEEVMQVKKRNEEVNVEDITVWIDPLDATQEYTEGGRDPKLLDYVMVMICIVVDKYPVAGVLHQPFVTGKDGKEGISYWGWVGHGVSASLEQGKKTVGDDQVVRVISSRSHGGNVRELAEQSYGDIEQTLAAGAGYKTVQVIQGKADVYLHTTKIKKWDTCAGNAIINAIGGAMTTLKGESIDYSYDTEPQIYDGLITTNSDKKNVNFRQKLHKN